MLSSCHIDGNLINAFRWRNDSSRKRLQWVDGDFRWKSKAPFFYLNVRWVSSFIQLSHRSSWLSTVFNEIKFTMNVFQVRVSNWNWIIWNVIWWQSIVALVKLKLQLNAIRRTEPQLPRMRLCSSYYKFDLIRCWLSVYLMLALNSIKLPCTSSSR